MSNVEKLKRRCEEAEALCELAVELIQLEDHDPMLDALVRRSLSILQAERGFLVLQRGTQLDFKVVRNWNREELEAEADPISRTILSEALRSDEPLLVQDALTDPRFSHAASVRGLRIRSVLAAPLRVDGLPVGALLLESRAPERLFRTEQLELFRRILAISGKVLHLCTKRLLLEERNRLLERDFLARYNFQGIVTSDPVFLQALETVAQAAATDLPVLVQGPSGSGKELVVRALHLNSARSKRPFRTVNCGAIAPQLLESELFGHVRGAFTGAMADKPGLIPSADGGTLFLDEVGELPREVQVKLLRTLQFGEVQPVGATQTQTVDVRFLAATNRDLEQDVRDGRFRQDLLYRLNAITVDLPPLRARSSDILTLFYHFLGREAEKAGSEVPEVTPRLERALQAYDWPGNVRELENETRRLYALTPAGQPLSVERLSRRVTSGLSAPAAAAVALGDPAAAALPTAANLAKQEQELIELHLRLAAGNRTQAAQSLGISRDGLRRKMKRYGLS